MLREYLEEVGEQDLPEIALTADLHPITARRKLDGLVAQGTVYVIAGKRGPAGQPARYGPVR